MVNQQIDQMSQAGGAASTGFSFLQRLVDPLQELHENAQRFYQRVRPHRMVSFFNDSYRALKDSKRFAGKDKYQEEIKGLLSKFVDYNSGGHVDRLDLKASLSTDTFEFLVNEFTRFEGTANEFFDNLIEDKVQGDLKNSIVEFLVDDMGEILEDLDENMEEFMERRSDEWENYDKTARDSFVQIGRNFTRTVNDMGRRVREFTRMSETQLLGLIGLLEATDIKSTIMGAATEELESFRDMEERMRNSLGLTRNEWISYRRDMRKEFRDYNEEISQGNFGMAYSLEDMEKAWDRVIGMGIRDKDAIERLTFSLMRYDRLFDFDVSSYTQAIQLMEKYGEDGHRALEKYTDSLLYLSREEAGLWDIRKTGFDQLEAFMPLFKSAQMALTGNEIDLHLQDMAVAIAALETSWGDSAPVMDKFRKVMEATPDQLAGMAGEFAAIGIDVRDFQDLLRSGDYVGATEQLMTGLSKVFERDPDQAMMILRNMKFDEDLVKNLAKISEQGKTVFEAFPDNLAKALSEIQGSSGYTQYWENEGLYYGNFFEKVASRLNHTLTTMPFFERIIDQMADMEIGFTDILKFGAYAKLLFGNSLTNAVHSLFMGKLGLITLGKAALFGKFGLITGFKLLLGKALLGGMGSMITSIFTGKLGLITLGKAALFGKFGLITGFKLLLGKALLPAVGAMFTGIGTAVAGIGSGLLGLLPLLAPIAGVAWAIWDAFNGVGKSVEWLGEEAGETLGGKIASGVGGALGGTDSGINGALKGAAKGAMIGLIFGPVGAGIGAIIGAGLGAVGGERISKFLYNTGQLISGWASSAGDFWKEKVSGPIMEGISNVKESFSERWEGAKDWWVDNISNPLAEGENLLDIGTRLTSGIRSSFSERWSDVKDWWTDNVVLQIDDSSLLGKGLGLVTSIRSSFSERWSDVRDWWSSNISNPLAEGDSLLDIGLEVTSSIRSSFSDRWGDVRDWWNDNVVSGIDDSSIVGRGLNIINSIRRPFSERFDDVKDWWRDNITTPLSEDEFDMSVLLGNSIEDFRTSLKDSWSGIGDWWDRVVTKPLVTFSDGTVIDLGSIWDSGVDRFKSSWSSIGGWWKSSIIEPIRSTWIGMINVIVDAINVVIGALNSISFEIPSWVPVIGGNRWGVDIPEVQRLQDSMIPQDTMKMFDQVDKTGQTSIPGAAEGGVLTVPRLILAGEAGPEALIPLDRFSGLDVMGSSVQSYLAQLVDYTRVLIGSVQNFALPSSQLAYAGEYGMSRIESGESSPVQVISDNSDVVDIIRWSTGQIEKKFDVLINEERRRQSEQETTRERRPSRVSVLDNIIGFD